MLICRNTSVAAIRFVRKIRGGSHPLLVDASDGHRYVVKCANNPQGPNVLCNEVLGTELYAAVGLPVPAWTPIRIPRSFLLTCPQGSLNSLSGPVLPEGGLCFGSRVLAESPTRLLEILPGSFLGRVANRSDFWLAWLVDLCAEHRDTRQSLFIESSGILHAFFVDHGHMFGGPDGTRTTPLMGPRYWDARIYSAPQMHKIRVRLRHISSTLNTDRLVKRIVEVPPEWVTESDVKNFFDCLDRLCRADYLEQTIGTLLMAFEKSYANQRAIPQLEPSEAPELLRPRLSSQRAGRHAVA